MLFLLANESLKHLASAIHVKGLAGDEVGVGGGEKEHLPDEVPRLLLPRHRPHLDLVLQHLGG